MIYIDLPADLNLEDDKGRNVARLADAVSPDTVTQGAVLVAGTPHACAFPRKRHVLRIQRHYPAADEPQVRAQRPPRHPGWP